MSAALGTQAVMQLEPFVPAYLDIEAEDDIHFHNRNIDSVLPFDD